MKTLFTLARADWAPAIRAAAGRVAYVVACAIVAAELAYRAGLATGRALHAASDRLAGLASGRLDRAAAMRAAIRWAHGVLEAPAAPVSPLTGMPAGARPRPYVKPAAPEAAPEAPSLADTFAAVAAAAAASDARLYRAAGESIARMRALLDEAETCAPEAPAPVVMACAPAAPAAPEAPAAGLAPPSINLLTVTELRAMARARGIAGMGRARRADLLAAMREDS